MILRCTKKLLKELNRDPDDAPVADNPLDNWHANCFRVDRRKCVLLTNDCTLYALFIPGLRKDDFSSFDFLVSRLLFKSLLNEGFAQRGIEQVLERMVTFDYAVTNNRSVLGSMNDQRNMLEARVYLEGGLDLCDVPELNKDLNRNILSAIEYEQPVDKLREILISSPDD